MKRLIAIALAAASLAAAQDYKNPKLPVARRVADLLSRMTLDEKVAQTHGLWHGQRLITDAHGNFDPAKAADVLKYGMGEITRPGETRGPREMVEYTNAIQRYVISHSRLGIPVIFHEECLHGEIAPKGTSFPQAIGLASTWDTALVTNVFTAVAQEARARGAQQCLAPLLDIARDPRWGRIEETYGEDPFLVSRIGGAAIHGFQGDGPAIDNQHVIATAKHFAAHGQPESGENLAPANYSERELRENFLRPFEYAVKHEHVGSIMPSYNEIDGIPSSANSWLLGKVLRQEWGFQGFTVSDYDAIVQLDTMHHIVATPDEAARLALETGVDLELPDIETYGSLAEQVRDGRIREAVLDKAVARILRAKFLAGLFDDPYADADRAEKVTNSPAHRALALKAAHETIVLLKNDGGLLPLKPGEFKTLAVIGPNAKARVLGGYSNDPGYYVSVWDGIKEKVGDSAHLVYAEGCQISAPGTGWHVDKVTLPDPVEGEKRVNDAVALANTADAVVLVLGGNAAVSREAYALNHLGDMDTLKLVGRQNELAEKIVKLGKPVVVVLLNGRPYSIDYIQAHVPAIVEGWYLGQETGHAMADVLFGEYNPAGRLPVTIARNVGQLPVYYNHKPSARRGYLLANSSPLFPFGWGLSYTTFRYSNVRLSPPQIRTEGTTEVLADVTNTGTRDGDEVAQLYIRDDVSSVTRPVEELRGFARVHLNAGETKTVRFRLGFDDLSFLNRDMHWVVEPGTFTVMVGGNSVDLEKTKLTVVP